MRSRTARCSATSQKRWSHHTFLGVSTNAAHAPPHRSQPATAECEGLIARAPCPSWPERPRGDPDRPPLFGLAKWHDVGRIRLARRESIVASNISGRTKTFAREGNVPFLATLQAELPRFDIILTRCPAHCRRSHQGSRLQAASRADACRRRPRAGTPASHPHPDVSQLPQGASPRAAPHCLEIPVLPKMHEQPLACDHWQYW